MLQEVVDRPRHAVALGLPGHDHRVEGAQGRDEPGVLHREAIAVGPLGHLRPEHRVVLGERVVALHLELGAAVPGDAVEEDRLLDRRDERVADAAEHGVVGPDGQVVLAALGEPARVVGEVAARVVGVDPERLGDRGVRAPAPGRDVLGRDERVGRRVPALLVDEPDRVEHLHRVVGVEAGEDLRHRAEVAIDPLAQAAAVVDRGGARAAGDEELEARDAERVLDVDGEQADAEAVLGGRAEGVLVGPGPRLACAILVRDPPDLADAAGVEVPRDRKLVASRAPPSRASRRS